MDNLVNDNNFIRKVMDSLPPENFYDKKNFVYKCYLVEGRYVIVDVQKLFQGLKDESSIMVLNKMRECHVSNNTPPEVEEAVDNLKEIITAMIWRGMQLNSTEKH